MSDSSHGVRLKDCPSIDIQRVCPLRAHCLPRQAGCPADWTCARSGLRLVRTPRLRCEPSAPECHSGTCSARAVSHDFGGLLHTRGAGLLHPAADHGVRLVSVDGSVLVPAVRRAACRSTPHDGPGNLAVLHCWSDGRLSSATACRICQQLQSRLPPTAGPKPDGDDDRLTHSPAPFPQARSPFEAFPSSTALPRRRGRCPLDVCGGGAATVRAVASASSLRSITPRPQGVAP